MLNHAMPTDRISPTVFDDIHIDLNVNEKLIKLSIWDTAGGSEFCRLRRLSYPDANVVVIVYSLHWQELFGSLESYWIPEIKQNLPNCPIILLGTDISSYEYEATKMVEDAVIKEFCHKHQIKSSHKVSILAGHGMRDLLDDIVFTGLGQEVYFPVGPDASAKCKIM